MNQVDKNNNFNNSNTGIKFNEEYSGERIYSPETSKIIGLVISSSGGLIKNAKQANYVLMGFVVIAVSISLFLVFWGENEPEEIEKNINPLTGEEMVSEEDLIR